MSSTDFTPAEIAAAGGHNLLVTTGTCGEAARTGRSLDPGKVVFLRPNTSPAAIFGTLDHPGKGALEKAHRGVVVLDDATRFDKAVLDSLRNTHGNKRVRLYRGTDLAPAVNELADFRLVIGTRGRDRRALTGPLLDRIDITTETATDSTADPAALADARAAQTDRLTPLGVTTNAAVPAAALLGDLNPGRNALARLGLDLDRAHISLRAYTRILRVAWTLADLTGKTTPDAETIETARTLRTL